MKYDVKDFQADVLELSTSIPVLVDFWAEWCGPCRILSPVLERLAEKHLGEWELKKLNTEEFPDIAGRYDIRSIPNVKLFADGKAINEFVGALPESSIERWLTTALPDKFGDQLDQAEALIRQVKYVEAKKLIEPVVAASPDHERARTLLAIALLYTDRKRAVDLVAFIDESSKYRDLAETVRTFNNLIEKLENPSLLQDAGARSKYLAAIRELSNGRFDTALEQFIAVIRQDRYYDEDGARKACIAIFKYLGEENEITMKHRREFGSALYT